MKKRILSTILLTFVVGTVIGFGLGFEFGTGLPLTTLFTPKSEGLALPESITVKTTEEAKQVVEEAVRGSTYDFGYNCLDYAWDSARALNWDGQPAAVAAIIYETGGGHALVLTATKDKNWLFLDPQTGIEVRPVPEGYWGGKKIVSVSVMVIHWVPLDKFIQDPKFEVREQ